MNPLTKLIERINKFNTDRNWHQFHNPKNLAISLSLEAAEVLEHFQWKTFEESRQFSEKELEELKQEVADVGIYLLQICDELNIDLIDAMERKIEINEKKYPIEKSKGTSKKYRELG
jgi:NTP pyrophosphatase (non-canonical NTP hydrolase)